MILDLVDHRDPILRQELEPFNFTNPPVNPLDLVTDLAETMLHHNGIGISANQCGLPYRVFVLSGSELIPCFNPKIVDISSEMIYLDEGCLSFPGLYVKIKRPRKIKVRYTEPNGNTTTRVFDGITARVFQHELNHLDGKVFTDLATVYHLQQARQRLKIHNRRLAKQGAY